MLSILRYLENERADISEVHVETILLMQCFTLDILDFVPIFDSCVTTSQYNNFLLVDEICSFSIFDCNFFLCLFQKDDGRNIFLNQLQNFDIFLFSCFQINLYNSPFLIIDLLDSVQVLPILQNRNVVRILFELHVIICFVFDDALLNIDIGQKKIISKHL